MNLGLKCPLEKSSSRYTSFIISWFMFTSFTQRDGKVLKFCLDDLKYDHWFLVINLRRYYASKWSSEKSWEKSSHMGDTVCVCVCRSPNFVFCQSTQDLLYCEYSIVNILLYKKLFYINIFHPLLDPSTFFTLHCKAAHKQCVFISVSIWTGYSHCPHEQSGAE